MISIYSFAMENYCNPMFFWAIWMNLRSKLFCASQVHQLLQRLFVVLHCFNSQKKKNQIEKVTWKHFKPRYFFVWLLQCICEKFQQTNKYYFEMNVLSGMFFHAFHLPRNLERKKKKFKMIVCFVYKRLNNIKRNASTCVFFFIRLHLFTHLMIIVSFGSDLNLRIML